MAIFSRTTTEYTALGRTNAAEAASDQAIPGAAAVPAANTPRRTKIKRSDWVALQALLAGAIAVGLFDFFLMPLPFWGALILGVGFASSWYAAALRMNSQAAIIDRLPHQ